MTEIKGSLTFKYFGSIFTNLGKRKEEMLNRVEQARKTASTLNSLLWKIHISLNTKKQILYTVMESILRYCCEIWTVEYRLMKTAVKYRNGFLEKSCKNIQDIKSKE
jgi:hypothetical protein